MLHKEDRSLDVYKAAGADMRLLRPLLMRVLTDVGQVVKKTDSDRLLSAISLVDIVCAHAEENMFQDFPGMPRRYVDVFYGAIDQDSWNELDEEMLKRAKRVANELFEYPGKDHRAEIDS